MITSNEDEFILTLPSNVESHTNTPNTPGDYVITLPQVTELEGDWEVALVDIQFPQQWCNFTRPSILVLCFIPRNAPAFSEDDVTLFTGEPKTYRETVLKDVTDICISFEYTVAVAIDLPEAYHENVGAYGEFLVKVMTDAFAGKKYKPELSLKKDLLPERYEFACANGRFEILCDTSYALSVLGMTTGEGFQNRANRDILIRRYSFPQHEQHPDQPYWEPGLDSPESVYVYSNIVKYQFVGDVMAPLLGVVPLTAKSGGLQYWCFNPPYYTRLQSNQLHTIQIRLSTDAGKTLKFNSTQSKVVSRLHFRRKRMRIWQ